MPNTGHDLNCSINAKPLGTISTILSMGNHWARSQRRSMPKTKHDPDCSINAKPLGMISTVLSMPNTAHDLIDLYAKRGTITSPTVIKAESIPTKYIWGFYVTS